MTPAPARVREALTPAAVAKLSTMQLRARAIVEGHYSGQHRSPYRGASVEFADHREYSHGDELRHLDWKVYGRTDRFFVKEYDAETNLSVHFLLDTSRSMDFAGPSHSPGQSVTKLDYARYLCAGLAYLAIKQRDAAALITFDAQVRERLPALTKRAHLQRIFDTLDAVEPGRDTDVAAALEQVAATLKRRGVIVLLSDLLDEPENLLRALGYFRHQGHDVILLHVMTPAERHFDYRGPTLFEDLESGERLLSDAQEIRADYLAALQQFMVALRDGCRQRRIDYQLLDTSRPYDEALTAYLGRREARAKG